MPELSLRFDDGKILSVPITAGDVVLDAALAGGVNLVHQCRSGSCATCICTIVSGDFETVTGRASALLKSEIAAGMRLSCSLIAMGDALIELPYPSSLVDGETPSVGGAEIRDCKQVSSTVWQLALLPRERLSFRPGQYLRVKVPGTEAWRSYSIASDPKEREVRLVIKEREHGLMSKALPRLKAGDTLDMQGPFGAFLLGKVTGPQIFIAGGTGLGPMIPMIDELRLRPGRAQPTILSFACSHESELFLLEELELRQYWMQLLDLRVGVSRPSPEWTGLRGNPLALVSDDELRAAAAIYVCGAPGLVEATRERCAALGIEPGHIRAEQFTAEENIPTYPNQGSEHVANL